MLIAGTKCEQTNQGNKQSVTHTGRNYKSNIVLFDDLPSWAAGAKAIIGISFPFAG
jgi:hypothetical protein